LKDKKFDLYAEKRKLLKEKRKIMNQVIGNDQVDGSTYQRLYSEATKTRRALKIELFGSKSKSSKYGDDTSIEKFVYDILDQENIKYVPQKAIRYINVDAYLPNHKMIIQVHGDYWHANKRLYPEPKNNIQRKNIEKDRIANEIAKSSGYHLVEIWEMDIKDKPLAVKEKLLRAIARASVQGVDLIEESSESW
jgi:G:T-mismatch repair DNA endonuclease (very short patch repair protein)